jgi:hypothetical protein
MTSAETTIPYRSAWVRLITCLPLYGGPRLQPDAAACGMHADQHPALNDLEGMRFHDARAPGAGWRHLPGCLPGCVDDACGLQRRQHRSRIGRTGDITAKPDAVADVVLPPDAHRAVRSDNRRHIDKPDRYG